MFKIGFKIEFISKNLRFVLFLIQPPTKNNFFSDFFRFFEIKFKHPRSTVMSFTILILLDNEK